MARNKKQEKKEISKNIQHSTNILYEGKVDIDFIRNGKRIKRLSSHNDGYVPLFTFILRCLSGDYREVDRPKYVYVFYIEESSRKDRFASSTPLNISSVSIKENEGVLSYKILVPISIFGSINKFAGLAFYSTINNPTTITTNDDLSSTNPSMKMYIKGTKLSDGVRWENEYVSDTDMLITWQLNIKSAKQDM